jgi:hypothetical protein
MKWFLGILVLFTSWFAISPVLAISQENSTPEPAKESPSADLSRQTLVYKNTKYGFSFTLPQTWEGYTILTDKWEGGDREKGDVDRGPVISIRHPGWTKESPRQDIPIMIFTIAQWDAMDHGSLSVGTAPVGPAELGRNRKYVFALAPRSSNTKFVGVDEVNEILRHDPLRPFWTK